jgi:chromosome segregation ATPase
MSNELNQNIANQEQGKDTQSLIIKLWELIRNTSEKINSFQERIIELEQKNMYLDKLRNEDSKKIHDLESQVDNVNHELELLNGNKNYYDDIVNSLESELESTSVYKVELDNIRNRYELLDLKLESIQKLADEVPVLKNEIDKKNSLLIKSNAKIEELQSLNKQLNTDLFNFIEIKKDLAAKNILLYERSNEIIKLKDKISFYDSKIFQLKNIETESESLKKHIVVLNNQFDEKKLQFENEKLDLDNKITDYLDVIKNLRLELGSYETLSMTLQENIKSQHQIINELGDDKNQLTSEIARLRNIIIENDKSLIQKSEENSNYESQITILQNLLMDKDAEIKEINNSLTLTLSELNVSKNNNESLVNMIETYQSKIDNLEKKIEQYYIGFNEKDDNILSLKIDLEETNNTLELKIVENNNLKYEIETLTTKLNEVESKFIIFESQIAFLESEIALKKHEITRLTKEYENEKDSNEKSIIFSENIYKSNLEKLNEQISDLHSEKILLTQRLSKINSKVERDSKLLTEKDEQIQIIENELSDLKNNLILYDADFDQYAKREEEYISKANELKKIISSLNEQVINKNSLIDGLKHIENQADELKIENEYLSNEINALKEKCDLLESAQNVESELNSKISELVSDNTIKEVSLNNLRQRVASLEDLLKTRYEQISILEKQINEYLEEKRIKSYEKKGLSEKIDKYIELIDEELNIKS